MDSLGSTSDTLTVNSEPATVILASSVVVPHVASTRTVPCKGLPPTLPGTSKVAVAAPSVKEVDLTATVLTVGLFTTWPANFSSTNPPLPAG